MYTKKAKRSVAHYDRQVLQFVELYKQETGNSGTHPASVAEWAIANGFWEPPREQSPIKILERHIKRAMGRECISDDHGEPVRARFPIFDEQTGKRLWVELKNATRDQVRQSAQTRKNAAFNDVLQIHRDVRYYNKFHNPGDPIEQSFNFDLDIEERQLALFGDEDGGDTELDQLRD